MIVPIKVVTLLVRAEESEFALSSLRELGVMQISGNGVSASSDTQHQEETVAAERLALAELERVASPEYDHFDENASGQETLNRAALCAEAMASARSELSTVEQRLRELAPWGDFDSELLKSLTGRGINITLCAGSEREFQECAELPEVAVVKISVAKKQVFFALVATEGVELPEELPLFRLAGDEDPRRLNRRREELKSRLEELDAEMRELLPGLKAARRRVAESEAELEFSRARDAYDDHEAVVSLRGFVPVPEIDRLRAAARQHGWGLLVLDPEENEMVPVLLKDNRFTRIIKPLFDFLGIVPGYHELDVKGAVLIFFTIFYAMIIGDAGYGVLFLLVGWIAGRKLRNRPAARPALRLFMILSVATVIWGALSGSWFGLEKIPGTNLGFPGLPCLVDVSESVRQANIQIFCFLLAAVQLSSGHLWKTFQGRALRPKLANIGWILVLWGNFILTVRIIPLPGEFPVYMYWLYGVGILLVIIGGVNWKDPADVFQFPFSIINSFTDVLSYIRLFAVGMAGSCIASSFNSMAFDICRSAWFYIPFGVVIILCGHGLNIALGFMSVLVHGVRLNTLEFSNHSGLTWSGQNFKPFRDNLNSKE